MGTGDWEPAPLERRARSPFPISQSFSPMPTFSDPATLITILGATVRAPSVLNSQPWRFVVLDDAVELRADRSRQLRALDPDGRELTMSCGAALLYLRVAAQHAGWAAHATPFPDDGDADLVARVTFSPVPRPDTDDRLYRALTTRRTNRHDFLPDAVPADVVALIEAAVALEGATLRVVTDDVTREALAGLVRAGVTAQGQQPGVQDDIGAWLRTARDPRPDGVSDAAQSVWDRHAVSRTTVASVAAHKARLVREAPAVLVLTTESDTPADWLCAGQALARALVVAADRGLAASYANEPVEVAALRPRVAEIAAGAPQAVFRLGTPAPDDASPRRAPSDVITFDTP